MPPDAEGIVAAIDTRALGLAVVALGGGRTRAEDPIDHSVGLTELAGLGDEVGPDTAARARPCARRGLRRGRRRGSPRRLQLGDAAAARRLIYERIGAEKA